MHVDVSYSDYQSYSAYHNYVLVTPTDASNMNFF
jgi:hypothetical protein